MLLRLLYYYFSAIHDVQAGGCGGADATAAEVVNGDGSGGGAGRSTG